MSTIHQGFNQRKLPLQFKYELPKPLIYPRNSNSILISTDSDESNGGIYTYNLDNNTFKLLQNYDIYDYFSNQSSNLEAHEHFIDYTNHQLCMFNGSSSDTGALFLDLKTKMMKTTDFLFLNDYPNAVNIPSEQIYIFAPSDNKHIIFDTKQQIVELEIDVNLSTDLTYCKLLYIESTSELMILGQDKRKDIWRCHIEQKSNQTKYDWKMDDKLKMPYAVIDERDHDVLLYNDIIIVLYFTDKNANEIWCLDLLHKQWFKSKYIVPKGVKRNSHVIKNNNNDIHILDFYTQNNFSINMYDLLPNDLIKLRRKEYEVLIIGYIRQKENELMLQNMPLVLKQLILLYFPLFNLDNYST